MVARGERPWEKNTKARRHFSAPLVPDKTQVHKLFQQSYLQDQQTRKQTTTMKSSESSKHGFHHNFSFSDTQKHHFAAKNPLESVPPSIDVPKSSRSVSGWVTLKGTRCWALPARADWRRSWIANHVTRSSSRSIARKPITSIRRSETGSSNSTSKNASR